MSRSKQYDKERVLERALRVFHREGFHGASLENLVNTMQISRASLYHEFSDKKNLYIEALNQYSRSCQFVESQRSAQQHDCDFYAFLSSMIAQEKEAGVCFLIKATTDLFEQDQQIQLIVKQQWEEQRRELESFLRNQFKNKLDAEALAYLLISLQIGLNVAGVIWEEKLPTADLISLLRKKFV